MPNHIKNIVRIKGDAKTIAEIKSKMGKKFDFNKLLPMPKELKGTNGDYRDNNNTPEGKALFEKYGHDNWYSWANDNWGTKWNCYDIKTPERVSFITKDGEKELVYEFYTAWASPVGVFEVLTREFPKIELRVEYADEDLGRNCGYLTYDEKNGQGGKLIETFEYACDIWGYDVDEMRHEYGLDDEDEDEEQHTGYANPNKITIMKRIDSRGDELYTIRYDDEGWEMEACLDEIVEEFQQHLENMKNE